MHVDHEPESEGRTASDVVTSRDEWDLEDERSTIWKLRRMTLGFVAVFLVTLYFARDGSNEGAAFRAALFSVPAVGFLVAQVVFEVKYRREHRARLESERDITRRITRDDTD